MQLTSRKLVALLLGVTLACDEGPSGLSTGNLAIAVSGLPTGSPADLVVSGPEGYSQAVTGTQTLTGLNPGTYTVTAGPVTVSSSVYSGTPQSQSVSVGGSTANASVLYSTGGGNLSVNITGLGTASEAAVSVSGPNGYSLTLTASQTITGLSAGTYTVTAQDVVASGGTTHTPTPATQDVSVSGSGTAGATVSYAPPSSGDLNLRVAGLYVTQSAQTYDGLVPLVKDRDGFLRVFAVASRTNTSAPAVQVRIYNSSNMVVSTVVIPAPTLAVPTAVDESALSYSWNTPVSGTLIQPGFRIEAEVDPSPGTVAESDETDNVLAPPAPSVQTMPALNLTFVPVIQQQHAARGDVGNVTSSNKDGFLSLTRKMHPIAGFNSVVRAAYTTTTTDTLQDDNGNSAWGTILAEIDAVRAVENPSRYYYGVAKVSYTSGVAGVAYVSGQYSEGSALGWDHLPSAGAVVSHELGHNWGRNHAPCGGPGGQDGSYPYADGSIGVYGLDVAAQSLKPASTSDIMGYCDPKWIGDYTYKAVMNYLVSPPPSAPLVSAVTSQSEQPCLLVWGHIRNGEMVLEPAFHVNTRPSLPRQSGPYTVEGRTEDGASVFSLSFTPSQIADARGNQQSFVFAIPLSDAQAGRIASLRLSGQGRETRRARARQLAPDPNAATAQAAEVRRVAGGRIGIRWDAQAHPMAMIRDAQTGEVLSFARGGSVEVASYNREVNVLLSDGVRSTARRLVAR